MSEKKSKPASDLVKSQRRKPCGCIEIDYADGRKEVNPCPGHAMAMVANHLGAAAEAMMAVANRHLQAQAQASMQAAAKQTSEIIKP